MKGTLRELSVNPGDVVRNGNGWEGDIIAVSGVLHIRYRSNGLSRPIRDDMHEDFYIIYQAAPPPPRRPRAMSEITPAVVKTAQDFADLLYTWGEANAATVMRDLATAYLAMAEENDRLRERVKDLEAEAHDLASDLGLCRATETQSHE